MKYTLMLVDDEPLITASLRRVLADEDYTILTATGGKDALAQFQTVPIAVVISDEHMPGMMGSEFLAEVRTKYPDTVRIMLTAHASIEAAMQAVNQGEIFRFFLKPWDQTELKLAVRFAIEKYRLESENRKLLKIIRRQASSLKRLEKQFPGISDLERDESGSIVLEEMSDDEMALLLDDGKQDVRA